MFKFRIGTRILDHYMYYEVRLYDTNKEMNEAYRRTTYYENGAHEPNDGTDIDGTAARVCPVRLKYEDGHYGPRIGYIFLCRNYCSTRIVSHEIVHAALEYYRQLNSNRASFGKHCGPKEELLAEIYESLFVKITRRLHYLNVWTAIENS